MDSEVDRKYMLLQLARARVAKRIAGVGKHALSEVSAGASLIETGSTSGSDLPSPLLLEDPSGRFAPTGAQDKELKKKSWGALLAGKAALMGVSPVYSASVAWHLGSNM